MVTFKHTTLLPFDGCDPPDESPLIHTVHWLGPTTLSIYTASEDVKSLMEEIIDVRMLQNSPGPQHVGVGPCQGIRRHREARMAQERFWMRTNGPRRRALEDPDEQKDLNKGLLSGSSRINLRSTLSQESNSTAADTVTHGAHSASDGTLLVVRTMPGESVVMVKVLTLKRANSLVTQLTRPIQPKRGQLAQNLGCPSGHQS
ncbi:hypothetical protein CPC08DRAFT_725535 [Agrocybe pediades]|nr:hypothetical protein CPC08DRAFT_725535 [Agrocybe pediades]